MINAVLNNIQIYPFSFYSAPKAIIQDIINIQQTFLWGGEVSQRKVCEVSWDSVCRSKKDEGLCIKYCGYLNQSLLSKWLWSITYDSPCLWKYLLTFKYGVCIKKV